MRIASILTLAAALTLPVTAFPTSAQKKDKDAPVAQHTAKKPVRHHLKTAKPTDKSATPAPATTAPAPATTAPKAPAPATTAPAATKTPAK